MMRDQILEYPYNGIIKRVIQGIGRAQDEEIILYDGEMDEHMHTDENGKTLQTASYIISIPLIKNNADQWVVPRKGDIIVLMRYGESMELVVDNAETSQLGGISIYASRKSW